MNKINKLEQDACDWAGNRKLGAGHGYPSFEANLLERGYLAGATSKYVEIEKLKFTIERLNILHNNLQIKYRTLTDLHNECKGKMREQHLRNKKAGISVSKEEIRRCITELEQQLKELENEKDINN